MLKVISLYKRLAGSLPWKGCKTYRRSCDVIRATDGQENVKH